MARWVNELRVALRSVLPLRRAEEELDEEIQFHLERQIAEGVKAGLTPEEARYAALRAMGAIEKNKDECRDVRSGNLPGEFVADLRYAMRALHRSPGFALLVVGIMALGIGANTAVFSVVNDVLLRPLPFPNPERIVVLRTAFLATGESQALVSIANFRDWRDRSSSFGAMSSYRPGETSVTTGGVAEYGRVASVDAQFFRVFGIEPMIGRTFTPGEVGPDGPLLALISHSCWQTHLGADARMLERTIRVSNTARSIIGVMPPGFQFPDRTDVWLPQTTRSTSRTGHNLFAVARLKPEVSLERAQAELAVLAAGLEKQYPESNKGRGVTAMPFE
jgi:MacB-like periplasmic core domain